MTMLRTWNVERAYYEGLTWKHDGDDVEREAATAHQLDKSCPQAQDFWRYHVAPATQRPNDHLTFHLNATKQVIAVAQRSYSVITYLCDALDYFSTFKQGTHDIRRRNWYNTLIYSGNAVQVFQDLWKKDIKNLLDGLPGGRASVLLPKFDGASPAYHAMTNFRHYVTHQGRFQIPIVNGKPHVWRPDTLTSDERKALTWTVTESQVLENLNQYTTLEDAADWVLQKTISWLNDQYRKLNETMEPLLATSEYQKRWGWEEHQPGVIVRPSSGHAHVSASHFCGTTSRPDTVEVRSL